MIKLILLISLIILIGCSARDFRQETIEIEGVIYSVSAGTHSECEVDKIQLRIPNSTFGVVIYDKRESTARSFFNKKVRIKAIQNEISNISYCKEEILKIEEIK